MAIAKKSQKEDALDKFLPEGQTHGQTWSLLIILTEPTFTCMCSIKH